jgi:hypothetical protein
MGLWVALLNVVSSESSVKMLVTQMMVANACPVHPFVCRSNHYNTQMSILGHGRIIKVSTQEIQVLSYWQHDKEWNNIASCNDHI